MYKWICKDKRDILQSKNVIRSKYLGNAREKEVVPKIYSNWIFVTHFQLAKDATNKEMRDKTWHSTGIGHHSENLFLIYSQAMWVQISIFLDI